MALIDNTKSWARRQLAPVTMGLMVAYVAFSLFHWFTLGKYENLLSFDADWVARPWTILTYPMAYMGLGNINTIIWSLMMLGWMNLTSASVERTIGTPKFAALWLTLTIVPALFYWAGELVVHQGFPQAGPFFPLAGVSYIWARNNKTFTMSLWFIPITGMWISWIIIAGVLFGFGMGAPLLGAFAALYLIPCHLYAENMIPFLPYQVRGYQNYRPSKQQREKEANYFSEVKKREQERSERERLRKLFESSLDDNDKR